jgi:hypothetical protein
MLKIQLGQGHAAGLQFVVVAAGTILRQQGRRHVCASHRRTHKNEAPDYSDALFQSLFSRKQPTERP